MESTKLAIINEANRIFYAMSTNNELSHANPETRYEFIQEQHKEFTRSFPLVATYMAEGEYDKNAFERLLRKIEISKSNQKTNYKNHNEDESMLKVVETQADYSKYMYMNKCKKTNQRYNAKTAKEIWEADYQRLYNSYKEVKEEYEQLESELKEEKEKNNEERKKELIDYVLYRSEKEDIDEVDKNEVDEHLSYLNGLINQFDDNDVTDLSIQKNIKEKVKEFEAMDEQSKPQLTKEEVQASFIAGTATEAFFQRKKNKKRGKKNKKRGKRGKKRGKR